MEGGSGNSEGGMGKRAESSKLKAESKGQRIEGGRRERKKLRRWEDEKVGKKPETSVHSSQLIG